MSDGRQDRTGMAGRERQPREETQEHRRAVERLLWTPTEGQDLTKSYFPLSETSDESAD
jgi:hypothetical protein